MLDRDPRSGSAAAPADPEAEPGTPPDARRALPAALEALTVHLCAEQLLAGWCTALSARSPAPMLGQTFVRLAADTSRRADAYARELRSAVQLDPGALPGVLRLALSLLRDDDHGRADALSVVDGRPPLHREDPHCIVRMLTLRRTLAG
jgi:hypothetical protein